MTPSARLRLGDLGNPKPPLSSWENLSDVSVVVYYSWETSEPSVEGRQQPYTISRITSPWIKVNRSLRPECRYVSSF